ncbi:MAG: B12-binding domain-containing radical SAM protein [Deltaproteobacteria bacterium GWC2_56_8]|nr:MAG: B12-binding domain-containing radical SAM protein [Deltaproteobacteria bacterium GWB2_55_19]OGP33212.1 MAG: B12-binding domain-containing radical SAM protein [Deltaproteobacteria bacterium GWC2_56_8]HAO94101.1 B12-binding domain-containing radical SAM protein [Deltaproteobacteria bacterium]
MKITLISPYPDITAFGIRTISAYLKKHGHRTQLIFLPDPYGDNLVFGKKRYEDGVLDSLISLCRDSDLIGLTLMTNFFEGAVQITEKLRSGLKAPVLWGGIHPTIRPEESLEYADIVCVGDGEEAALELADRMEKKEPFLDVRNLWVKEKGRIHKNPPRSLPHDLDVYPRPDYSLEDAHVLFDGRIQKMDYALMKACLEKGTVSGYLKKTGYQTMTGRGCPHKCTYCINDTLKGMYNNENYLRWRSTGHVMEELVWVRENLPYVGFVWISDDAFFARNKKSLEEFCLQYKEKIGLPFSCLASPMTISEEKMSMLVDAGLVYLQMGVESGSKKIQELFNRKQMDNERLRKAFGIINKYKDRMFPPSYDFILDVPYETDADKIESLKLIADIPKPFHLQPFSLVLYPGTKLYEMAKKDGLLHDEKRQIYEKSYTMRAPNYLNLLITLSKNGRFPAPVLKMLVSSPAVDILNSRPLKPLFKFLFISLKSSLRLAKRLTGAATA